MRLGSGMLGWALSAAAIAAAGCGSGATFTAEEVVAAANEHGAQLELGEPLPAGEGGMETHGLGFADAAEGNEDAAEDHDDVHAGGSLVIAPDDEAALAQYHRCEQAASLICFRAANAVLFFEDTAPRADLERLEGAIRAMGSR